MSNFFDLTAMATLVESIKNSTYAHLCETQPASYSEVSSLSLLSAGVSSSDFGSTTAVIVDDVEVGKSVQFLGKTGVTVSKTGYARFMVFVTADSIKCISPLLYPGTVTLGNVVNLDSLLISVEIE